MATIDNYHNGHPKGARNGMKMKKEMAQEKGLNVPFFILSLAVIICFMLSFISICVVSAATYHVRNDGNDTCTGIQNVGYAENQTDCAWQTITHALATITAGDTVRVQSGTYNESPELTHSGNSTHPIQLIGDGNPVLDGGGVNENGFYVHYKEYYEISGFTIQNYTNKGIYLMSEGYVIGEKNITLENNTIRNVSVGIMLYGMGGAKFENALVRNNNIEDTSGDAMWTKVLSNSTISYNTLYNIGGNGLDWSGTNTIIEHNDIRISDKAITTGSAENCEVRNNYIETCNRGIRFDWNINDNMILNNTIINGTDNGIQIYPNSNNYLVANNTLDGARIRYMGGSNSVIENNEIYNTNVEITGEALNPTFRNNFLKDCSYLEIGENTQNFVCENNIFINFSGQPGAIFLGYSAGSRKNITIKNNVFYSIPVNAIEFSASQGNTIDQVDIKNNVFMNVGGHAIDNNIGTNISVSYNDVYNGVSPYFDGIDDENTIEKDPLFVDPMNDFHLKSQYGRWNGSTWVYDDVTSPCIDAGDPSDDYSNEPAPKGSRINMGAYGNTVEASKSPGSALGTISGTVTDINDTAIINATVTDGTRATTTNQTRGYVIANIPADTYTVTASAANYTTASVPDVTVTAGNTTMVNFTLNQSFPTPTTSYTFTQVVMTFFRSDDLGLAYTNYSKLSAAGPWTTVNTLTATGPDAENVTDISEDMFNLTISDEGATTIWYYSVNNNGTFETVKNVTVKIAIRDFGVDDTSGYTNTYVEIPVTITNAQNGPIASIRFDLQYNTSVITVVDVQKGTLTSFWDSPTMNTFAWGSRILLVYDGNTTHALQNGSTGSVALLNVSVIGESGETSVMNLSDIQLADTAYNVGTAPAKNGTFTVLACGSITGYVTNTTGGGLAGVAVNLTLMTNPSVQKTTSTNETGYYSFTTVDTGEYTLNCSKQRYWQNTTTIIIDPDETETKNIMLWKKGDLNDNSLVDAGDLAMMKDASVGTITADEKYDLNRNGIFADASDQAMMKDAFMGTIELL